MNVNNNPVTTLELKVWGGIEGIKKSDSRYAVVCTAKSQGGLFAVEPDETYVIFVRKMPFESLVKKIEVLKQEILRSWKGEEGSLVVNTVVPNSPSDVVMLDTLFPDTEDTDVYHIVLWDYDIPMLMDKVYRTQLHQKGLLFIPLVGDYTSLHLDDLSNWKHFSNMQGYDLYKYSLDYMAPESEYGSDSHVTGEVRMYLDNLVVDEKSTYEQRLKEDESRQYKIVDVSTGSILGVVGETVDGILTSCGLGIWVGDVVREWNDTPLGLVIKREGEFFIRYTNGEEVLLDWDVGDSVDHYNNILMHEIKSLFDVDFVEV